MNPLLEALRAMGLEPTRENIRRIANMIPGYERFADAAIAASNAAVDVARAGSRAVADFGGRAVGEMAENPARGYGNFVRGMGSGALGLSRFLPGESRAEQALMRLSERIAPEQGSAQGQLGQFAGDLIPDLTGADIPLIPGRMAEAEGGWKALELAAALPLLPGGMGRRGGEVVQRLNRALSDATAANRGATYSTKGDDLFGSKNFVVAARSGDDMVVRAQPDGGVAPEDLDLFYEEFSEELADESNNVGTWRREAKPGEEHLANEKGEVVVLDVARTFPRTREGHRAAWELARTNGQDAIFDLEAGEEIFLKDPNTGAPREYTPWGQGDDEILTFQHYSDAFRGSNPPEVLSPSFAGQGRGGRETQRKVQAVNLYEEGRRPESMFRNTPFREAQIRAGDLARDPEQVEGFFQRARDELGLAGGPEVSDRAEQLMQEAGFRGWVQRNPGKPGFGFARVFDDVPLRPLHSVDVDPPSPGESAFRGTVKPGGEVMGTNFQGADAILTRNTRPGEGAYRISFVHPSGPMSHQDFPNMEAAKAAFDDLVDPATVSERPITPSQVPPPDLFAPGGVGPDPRVTPDELAYYGDPENARLERLRAAGFDTDTPLYHGTNQDFERFDLSRAGTGPAASGIGGEDAIFLTNNPNAAQRFAGMGEEGVAGQNVRPVFARRGNLARAPMMTDYDPFLVARKLEAARERGLSGVRFQGMRDWGHGTEGGPLVDEQTALFSPDDVIGRFDDIVPPPDLQAPNLGPSGRESPFVRRPVRGVQRPAPFPGIYDDPRVVAAEAEARVAPESGAMERLFGVTRQDLTDIALGRRGDPSYQPSSFAGNPQGSEAAEGITTPANTGRLVDVLGEGQRYAPELTRGMTGWYIMDPAFQRLQELVGPEEAARMFRNLTAGTGLFSPGSDVLKELTRGTHALWLTGQGRLDDFMRYGGMPANRQGGSFLSALRSRPVNLRGELAALPGHPYHSTAQAPNFQRFIESGVVPPSPKVEPYIDASGVPGHTPFQTTTPVGDAHWSRAVGLADVRPGAGFRGSVSDSELFTLTPWWRDRVAAQLGYESVPAQANLWGLMAPRTGVETPVGVPKLELFADLIEQTARQRFTNPLLLRDRVLLGQEPLGTMSSAALQRLLRR